MFTIEEVREIGDLHRHVEEWHGLLASSRDAEFFQTPEWLITWLECFWRSKPLTFLFVRRDGELVGLAPFISDHAGRLGCPGTIAFPRHPHAPRCGVVERDGHGEVLAAVLDHLSRTRKRLRISFARVRREARCADGLTAIARRYRLSTLVIPDTASLIVTLPRDWNAYLTTRSKHLRGELRRKRRRIAEAGEVEYRVVTSPAEWDRSFGDVLSIETASWKHLRGTSVAAEQRVLDFYAALGRRSAERRRLRLYLLYIDSRPAAHVFGVTYGAEYLALKTSYDERFRELSPGVVTFQHALRDLCESGFAVADLLGMPARWKHELANGSRPHVTACAFRKWSVRCTACRAYHDTLKPLLKDQVPLLVTAKRRLEAMVNAVS